MTRWLLAALLLAGCATAPPPSPPGSVDPDPGPPAARVPGPKLAFTARGHDFGRREKHERITHTAVFYNVGSETLLIREVRTHCGCFAALLSSPRVPPGGRGTLAITLDVGRLPGKKLKDVEVLTNDPRTPVATYPVSCEVIADAALDPAVLAVRGTRAAGEVSATFDVVDLTRNGDLEIRSVRPGHPAIGYEVSPIPVEEGRAGYRVRLTFGEGLGSGAFHQRVVVDTNSRRDPRLVLTIVGWVREALTVVPERLYYPRLRPGDSITRKVFVERPDGHPFRIKGVKDTAGMFETNSRRIEPHRWVIEVLLAGESPARTVRGSLVILTDAAGEPRVTVPYEVPGEEDR